MKAALLAPDLFDFFASFNHSSDSERDFSAFSGEGVSFLSCFLLMHSSNSFKVLTEYCNIIVYYFIEEWFVIFFDIVPPFLGEYEKIGFFSCSSGVAPPFLLHSFALS